MKKIVTILFAAACFSIQAQKVSDADQEFAKGAAGDGMLEVRLGQLAQAKGSTNVVKELGKMMEKDHSKANEELKALASRKNIVLPSALNEKQQEKYDKLAAKEGKDFDKAYSECMVDAHKEAIDKFEKESKKGDDTELKNWATTTLPTLKHHKEMSESTNKSLK